MYNNAPCGRVEDGNSLQSQASTYDRYIVWSPQGTCDNRTHSILEPPTLSLCLVRPCKGRDEDTVCESRSRGGRLRNSGYSHVDLRERNRFKLIYSFLLPVLKTPSYLTH